MINPKTNSTSTPLEDDAQLATRKKAMKRLTVAVVGIIGIMALLTFVSRFQSSQKTTSEVTPLNSVNASLTLPTNAPSHNNTEEESKKSEQTPVQSGEAHPVLPANTPPGLLPKSDGTSATPATPPEVKVHDTITPPPTPAPSASAPAHETPSPEQKTSDHSIVNNAKTNIKETHETPKKEVLVSKPETVSASTKLSEKTQADDVADEQPKIQVQATSKGYAVQLGMFNSTGNAEKLHQKLNQSGIKAHIESRVYIGPFKNKAEADAAIKKAKDLGIDAVVLPAH